MSFKDVLTDLVCQPVQRSALPSVSEFVGHLSACAYATTILYYCFLLLFFTIVLPGALPSVSEFVGHLSAGTYLLQYFTITVLYYCTDGCVAIISEFVSHLTAHTHTHSLSLTLSHTQAHSLPGRAGDGERRGGGGGGGGGD
jgi:hypothetical protein